MPETNSADTNLYKRAVMALRKELTEIQAEAAELETRRHFNKVRAAKVEETLVALESLMAEDVEGVGDAGLLDVCREVMRVAVEPKTAPEVRDKLELLKFDFSKYARPVSAVYTALTRLAVKDEVRVIEVEGKKRFIYVKLQPGANRQKSVEAVSRYLDESEKK